MLPCTASTIPITFNLLCVLSVMGVLGVCCVGWSVSGCYASTAMRIRLYLYVDVVVLLSPNRVHLKYGQY